MESAGSPHEPPHHSVDGPGADARDPRTDPPVGVTEARLLRAGRPQFDDVRNHHRRGSDPRIPRETGPAVGLPRSPRCTRGFDPPVVPRLAQARRRTVCRRRGTVGTITKIVIDEDTDPEALPAYDITIAARLPTGGIHRTCRVSERTAPKPGQRVRFRHNTGDPDDLEDVLFLGFVDAPNTAQRGTMNP